MNALTKFEHPIEILNVEDDVTVHMVVSPLSQMKVSVKVRAGSTVRECIQTALEHSKSPFKVEDFRVFAGEHHWLIPTEYWNKVRPKPGTYIVAQPIPKEMFTALFTAVSAVITSIQSALGGLGILGKLLLSGVSMGVKYLLNTIFAPKQADNRIEERKPNYSVSGTRNQIDRFGPVPVILGTHRVSPTVCATPYTTTVGSEQYITMMFVVGYGPLTVSDIRIGETPIANYEDVTWEINQGFTVSTSSSLYPYQVIEESLNIELVQGVNNERTTAENVTQITVDLVWPQGVIWVDATGQRQLMGASFQIYYRNVLGGPYTLWIDGFFQTSSQDTIRNSYTLSVAAGQYEVLVVRTSAHIADPGVIDNVNWTGLKGYRFQAPIAFNKPLCTITVKIRASSQLNGLIDTLNLVATSLCKHWNGSTWVDNIATRNPASLYRLILQGHPNARPVADSKIDLVALQQWSTYCSSSGWTYDKPVLGRSSVLDALTEVCAAGRATPIFKDGKWSVVWDEADTPIVQMFTPRNSWGFEGSHTYQEIPHAFRMPFVNAAKKYAEDERIVYDDGYNASNATKFAQLVFPGVTNTDLIWKHGRYHIASLRLRPAQYSLTVDFEGLVLTRNDRVRVQHDVMMIGLGSFRVKAFDGTLGAQTVTVDDLCTFDDAKTYVLRFRLIDGTYLSRTVAAGTSGELFVIPLSGDSTLPDVGDLGVWGESGTETSVFRITAIEPTEDFNHRLTLVDDAPGIYLADTGVIPDYNSNISEPVDPFTLGPQDLRLTGGSYFEGTSSYEFIRSSWILNRTGHVASVTIQYKATTSNNWITAASVGPDVTNYRINGLISGLYQTRVRSIFQDGTYSGWTVSEIFNADSLNSPPGNVQNFRIATIGDLSTLSWSPVIGTNIVYEIRFVPASGLIVAWNNATPILTNLSGTSVQVQTMVGTYFIKAKYLTGTYSTAATLIQSSISSLSGLNVIEVIQEDPSFAGVHDATEILDGEVRLQLNNTIDSWDFLSNVITMDQGINTENQGYEPEGYYYFANSIDLTEVYTSRITAVIDAYGFNSAATMDAWATLEGLDVMDSTNPGDWSVALEYRATNVDPIMDDWTAWQQLLVGDVTARALEFRLHLEGKRVLDVFQEYATISPAVIAASVQIDMPDRIESANDVPVGTGGLSVVFDPAFADLKGVAIAAQDMATGDYAVITGKDPAGFDIIFRNSAGVAVARTFDWIAKGYGRVSP